MPIYRQEGLAAFRDYAAALAEEQAVAYELSQCAKIDVYPLLAQELFDRMVAAHTKTAEAFTLVQCFKYDKT